MKKTLCMLITLTLICSFFVQNIYAKTLTEINNNNLSEFGTIVIENGKEYDLSKLEDAKIYFENNDKIRDILKNKTALALKKDLEKNISRVLNSPELSKKYQKDIKNLQESGFLDAFSISQSKIQEFTENIQPVVRVLSNFSLESRLQINKQSMFDNYNSIFNIIYSGSNDATLAAQSAYVNTSIYFASKVREGGDWDYKRDLGWNTYYNTYIDGSYYNLPGEDIGNIHFGYVGKTMFADFILKSAAGFVQILSGTSNISYYDSYWDDPNDQQAIQRGIDYYKNGYFN